MNWTDSDLAAINAAIAAGEQLVRLPDGREVQYRSVTELLKARDQIQAELRGSGPQRLSPRHQRAVFHD